jgi:hypothetical protein
MKFRHAAALALGGWYLMVAPLKSPPWRTTKAGEQAKKIIHFYCRP